MRVSESDINGTKANGVHVNEDGDGDVFMRIEVDGLESREATEDQEPVEYGEVDADGGAEWEAEEDVDAEGEEDEEYAE